jgi:hypothetical protein
VDVGTAVAVGGTVGVEVRGAFAVGVEVGLGWIVRVGAAVDSAGCGGWEAQETSRSPTISRHRGMHRLLLFR